MPSFLSASPVAHFGISASGMKTRLTAFSLGTTQPSSRSVDANMKHTIKSKKPSRRWISWCIHRLQRSCFPSQRQEKERPFPVKQQVNWLLGAVATMEQVSCLRLLEIGPKDLLPNTEEQCIIIHLTVRAAT